MSYRFITFEKSNLESDMAYAFDENMLGKVHLCISSNNDYTLCSHATDEYETKEVNKKPNCPDCLSVVNDIKGYLADSESEQEDQGKGE